MKAKIVSVVLAVLLMGLIVLPGCVSKAEYNELKAQIAEQVAQIEKQEAQINKLEGQVVQQKLEISKLENEVEAKNARIADLEKENLELRKEIHSLKLAKTDRTEIEITFSPNPVPCQDGHWRWTVTLKEVNGVGVKLDSIILKVYGADAEGVYLVASWNDESWLNSLKHYLKPFGHASSRRFFTCAAGTTYTVFTVTGVDDNGHWIRAEGRVDFLQP